MGGTVKSVLILMALGAGGEAFAQVGPPPLVEAYTPAGVSTSSNYDCEGTRVALQFSARSGVVNVENYSDGPKKLGKGELEKWNIYLRPLKAIDSSQFLCGKSVSSITFTGPTNIIGQNSVSVYIEDGKVKPIRLVEHNK